MTQTQNSKTVSSFKPLGNRVLVRRLAAEEKLKGGIILPDVAKKKQEKAEVMALGTGKRDKNDQLIPIPLKKGDIILMEKYSGQEVTIDGETYVIVPANDVIAILE